MVSVAEKTVSRLLREILADLHEGAIPDTEQFQEVMVALQFFLPVVLSEINREWNFEGLDDIVPVLASKTGAGEAEILGLCCIISDQTLTPLHVHLQVADPNDEVSWLECRLGERGQGGMVRTPYQFLNAEIKRLLRFEWSADQIDWVYKVTYGERRFSG